MIISHRSRNVKRIPLTLIVVLGLSFQAEATDIKTILSKPAAGNPRFGDQTVWPDLHGDEYFQRQKWEEGRVLIWDVARSLEKRAGRRNSSVDGSDPRELDRCGDRQSCCLPAGYADGRYPCPTRTFRTPRASGTPDIRNVFCRHVTIGRNAALDPLYARGGFQIAGNLWIQPGGAIKTGMWTLMFIGDKHTFVRNDWPEDGVLEKIHKERRVTPYEKKDIRKQPWWNKPDWHLHAARQNRRRFDGGRWVCRLCR